MRSRDLIDWSDPFSRGAPLNQGLVSWWLAGEGPYWGGPLWLDLVPRGGGRGGNHGTLTGMTTASGWRGTTRPGGFGSLAFDGVNNHVVTPDASAATGGGVFSFDDAENWSVSFWYFGTDTDTGVSSGGVNLGTGLLGRDNGDIYANIVLVGGLVSYRHFNTTWQTNITSTTTVADGRWHHVCLANRSSVTMDLYVDGLAEVTGASSAIGNAARRFVINNFMRSYQNRYTGGELDDVRVYSRALSDAEVRALYDESRQGYPTTLRRLPAYPYRRRVTAGGLLLRRRRALL